MDASADTVSDTAPGRPARRSATPRSVPTREASAPAWFEAASPFGVLRLCVFTPDAARHAGAAAVALQEAAALLDAFDDWTLLEPDWRWIAAPPAALATSSHVWADSPPAADVAPAARLELPWALLRHLPSPPEALAARLRWPTVPTAVVVARLQVDADELAALETGGAVLLPESMGPDWHGVLRAADEPASAGVPLALSTPLAPAVLERGPVVPHRTDDADKPFACEVRLASTRAFGADCLAGWLPGTLGELGPRASLWRSAEAQSAARYLASGRLMPWGDGWALALEAVCASGTAALLAKD